MGTQEEGGTPGETDLIIAKHRNGEVCDVKMRFLSSEVKFVDYNDRSYGTGYDDGAVYKHVQSKLGPDYTHTPSTEFDLDI